MYGLDNHVIGLRQMAERWHCGMLTMEQDADVRVTGGGSRHDKRRTTTCSDSGCANLPLFGGMA
jgi:hypothetical protein